jgi:superfamily II DNA/RNA helicase
VQIQVEAANTAVKSVKQWLVTTDKRRKPELFLHLLNKLGWAQALVFVKTRKGAEALVKELQEHGLTADAIHGDKTQPARLRALDRFKRKEVQLLIATDVAARGLDIEALPLVVNFDLPTVAEDYIHRIGRTGRAGMQGEAVSLVCADEVDMLKAIETLTRQLIPRFEEAGFEADHRVPETAPKGSAVATQKLSAPGAGKKATGKPAANAKRPVAAPAKIEARPAGGNESLGTYIPPEKPSKSSARDRATDIEPNFGHKSGRKGTGPRAGGGFGGGRGTGGGAPKGAVVVAGGRGAKSQARSDGRAAAKPGGRKSKPGSR